MFKPNAGPVTKKPVATVANRIGTSLAAGLITYLAQAPTNANAEPTPIQPSGLHRGISLPPTKSKSGAELVSARNVGVEVAGRFFEFYDLPRGPISEERTLLINKLFSPNHMDNMQTLKNSKSGSANPSTIQNSPLDEFASIWNIYREANNDLNFSRSYKELKKEIEELKLITRKDEVVLSNIQKRILGNQKNNSILDTLQIDRGRIESKIRSQEKSIVTKIIALTNLEEYLKKEQRIERLMVMLSVINRNLSRSYPKTSAENIARPDQYSWTRATEDKFPMSRPNQFKRELISINVIAEISELYSVFVDGRTLNDAKTAILNEVSNLSGIPISELPTNCIDYNTVSLLPGIDSDFSRSFSIQASRIMGENTRRRVGLQLDQVLGNGGLIFGSHVFVNQ